MNDDELRQLIRAAIQSAFAREASVPPQPGAFAPVEGGLTFGQYRLERASGDTSCLIEPAVQCNHCGFCKCHGH